MHSGTEVSDCKSPVIHMFSVVPTWQNYRTSRTLMESELRDGTDYNDE